MTDQRSWAIVARLELRERVVAALRAGSSALIIGDPGVGKSVLTASVRDDLDDGDSGMVVLRAPSPIAATPWQIFAPLIGTPADPGGNAVGRISALAKAALAEHCGPSTIHIEDVHDLDGPSAVILAELVQNGDARLLATCRRMPGPPSPLRTLLREDRLAQIDVHGLELEEVEQLLIRVLGGPVSRDTSQHLAGATQGNPLYLRELVRALRETGALAFADGAWLWRDPEVAGTRVVDLIRAELSGLGEAERDIVDLLALAGPTTIDVLGEVTTDDALEAAVLRGLVVIEPSLHAGAPEARLVHPIHTDVIRGTLLPGRRRELFHRLPAAAQGTTNPATLFSTVDWALTCGVRPQLEPLLAAVRAATMLTDPKLVERLAAAALEQLPREDPRVIDVLLARAASRRYAGKPGRARRDLAHAGEMLEHRNGDDSRRSAHARILADLAQYGDDDLDGALRILASADLSDRVWDERRRVDVLTRLAYAGRFAECLDELDERVRTTDDATMRAIMTGSLVLGLGQSGHLERAVALADESLGSWRVDAFTAPWLLGEVTAARFFVGIWLGDIEPPRRRRIAELDPYAQLDPAVAQLGEGRYSLARGRWSSAAAHFRGALARYAVRDPSGFTATAWAGLAAAAAALGDAADAREALTQFERTHSRASKVVTADNEVNILVAALALGEADTAERAEALAERSEREGLWWGVVRARHLRLVALARRGSDAAGELHSLEAAARRVDGPVPALLLDHARALIARDPLLVARASGRLLERGVWVPAEATAPVELTSRQREVVGLVAAGLTNREIADRLMLSTRTVDAHVRQVFERVGVNSRAALSEWWAGSGRGSIGSAESPRRGPDPRQLRSPAGSIP
ncbi:helix-turn-helix transcriptional regulator [Microbacterium halotolerans]|uniref:helix-turn-helix transcriptional regulator n=1 Tax=Microbacterium halotolerans TaxID=246613 RepID=UPI000E6AB18B|nr:LuxR C-terminal-related transcriptional regulator [Microbacterium halotolerans]